MVHSNNPNVPEIETMLRRILIAIVSGAIAITVNVLALKLADRISLPTAHGGLLRLISPWLARPISQIGLGSFWIHSGGPSPSSPLFQVGFHIAVGITMAVFYACFIEPVWRGSAFLKGLLFAAVVWLLNAAVVLPLTGEGFAGREHLSLAGMVWFAAAHTLFFVTLSLLFQMLYTSATKVAGAKYSPN